MRKFGLIGYPLEHSFSPSYFNKKFTAENISGCSYDLFPLKSIEELNDIIHDNPELVGFNVTIPYKQSIIKYLNSVVGIPSGLYSCNCVKIKDGRLIGYNTDVIGFEKSLKPLLQSHHSGALIFGNGGSTIAVAHVLKNLGVEYQIVSREIHHGSTLTYNDLTPEMIGANTLLINTTPVGMFPLINDCISIPYQAITNKHVCYDLVYNPEKTLFLNKAEKSGAIIKNGYEMLTIQAEESWRIWND